MLTYDNWFAPEFLSGQNQPKYVDPWQIKFNHTDCDTEMTFPDAIKRALELISQTHDNIIVQYSGGLDSEIIIREAIKSGIDVTPYTLRFHNNLNEHEIYYCKLLESDLGIEVKYIDIDIEAWWSDPEFHKGYCHYITHQGMWHPAAPLAWWMRERISEIHGDCCVINGSGDPPLIRRPDRHNICSWQWGISYNLDGHWKRLSYSEQKFPQDVPLFFLYIPELHYSYLTHDVVNECVQPNSFKLGPTSTRHKLYLEYYPEITPRTKYHGFENLLKLNKHKPEVYHKSYAGVMNTRHIPYEEYIRMLRGTTHT